MPVVRVYVPLGRAELEALARTGELAAGPGSPRPAHAVTADLEQARPGLDVEDLEYAAFRDAVDAASVLRAAPGERRVVAAADADPGWVAQGDGLPVSAVALVAPVPRARIASFHVDEEAGFGLDDDADELLWYDVTELDDVRALLD